MKGCSTPRESGYVANLGWEVGRQQAGQQPPSGALLVRASWSCFIWTARFLVVAKPCECRLSSIRAVRRRRSSKSTSLSHGDCIDCMAGDFLVGCRVEENLWTHFRYRAYLLVPADLHYPRERLSSLPCCFQHLIISASSSDESFLRLEQTSTSTTGNPDFDAFPLPIWRFYNKAALR